MKTTAVVGRRREGGGRSAAQGHGRTGGMEILSNFISTDRVENTGRGVLAHVRSMAPTKHRNKPPKTKMRNKKNKNLTSVKYAKKQMRTYMQQPSIASNPSTMNRRNRTPSSRKERREMSQRARQPRKVCCITFTSG